MFAEKLAVVFPGLGYHSDKPLLYFSKRLARQAGYEVLEITYDFPFKPGEVKGDQNKMEKAFDIAVKQAGEQLSQVEFDRCSKVLFIGKSIGTAVAAHYDKEHDLGAKQLVFTPVPGTFKFLREGGAVVYHGLSDPWCGNEIVREKCSELKLELHEVEGANHSLETDNAIVDAANLEYILKAVAAYI